MYSSSILAARNPELVEVVASVCVYVSWRAAVGKGRFTSSLSMLLSVFLQLTLCSIQGEMPARLPVFLQNILIGYSYDYLLTPQSTVRSPLTAHLYTC